jgi:hypothetical protein
MKATTKVLMLAVLGAGLIAGVIVLAMWPAGGSGGPAQANSVPAPIVVGYDMNTAGNTCPGNGTTNCTLGAIDACVQAPAPTLDGKVNDGCPNQGSYSEGDDWCGGAGDAVDQDGDTTADDGCPGGPTAVGISEAANHCNDAVNDDPTDDGLVNDGCPQVACVAETGTQCANDTDDDPASCITFDVFLNGLPAGGTLLSFSYATWEKDTQAVGTVTAFTHDDSTFNLIHQFAPRVGLTDFSLTVPAPLPGWYSNVADLSGGLEASPPFTKGVLSRLTANIPDTTPDGLYYLTLLNTIVGDKDSEDYCEPGSPVYVGCDIWDGNWTDPQPYGIIAVGDPCPTFADVGVTQVVKGGTDCNSDPPTQMPIATDTTLCLRKTIVNNGPEPSVNGTIDTELNEPEGCTITPVSNPNTFTGLTSTPQTVDEKFTVHCDDPSTHVFTFDNEIQPTAPVGVVDANQDNNTASTEFTIPVTATANVRIDSQALATPTPATIYVGVDTDVTLTKDLRNAGPYGPVDVDVTTAVATPTPPPACTANLKPPTPTPVSLPVEDVAHLVTEVWTLNCGAQATGVKFTFNNSIGIITDHVNDPGIANNSASTDLTVDVVPLVGDVNCDGVKGTAVDAGFIFQFVLGLKDESLVCPLPDDTLYLPGADANGDTIVDVIDAGFIFRCLLGYHNVFCPEV